jgi:hypothetical protein
MVWWSEFLATDTEILGSIPGAQIFWELVCLERGPLSLVTTIEKLLGRKSNGFGLEIEITAVGIRRTNHKSWH